MKLSSPTFRVKRIPVIYLPYASLSLKHTDRQCNGRVLEDRQEFGGQRRYDDPKRHRENEVAFLLAKLTLEKYFRQDNEQKTDRPSVHRFDADVRHRLGRLPGASSN